MADELFPWADKWSDIVDPQVLRAFAHVDRRWFVDEIHQKWADRDMPLPIGEGQTISQPYVVALMLQAMRMHPGDRVLEIGAGSGFQTALLCEMTFDGERCHDDQVYALERFEQLADTARRRLEEHDYHPNVVVGDGALGWPSAGPYQAIVVSAAARCVPQPLWDQLDEGGRLVIPVGRRFATQTLWLLEKNGNRVKQVDMGPVRFVPLVSPVLESRKNCLDNI